MRGLVWLFEATKRNAHHQLQPPQLETRITLANLYSLDHALILQPLSMATTVESPAWW